MTTTQLIIVCVTGLTALGGSLLALYAIIGRQVQLQNRFDSLEVGLPVVVNTRDDQSIRGVVLRDDHGGIRIGSAHYMRGQRDQPLGGVVRVPRDNVSWVQDLSPLAADNVEETVAA